MRAASGPPVTGGQARKINFGQRTQAMLLLLASDVKTPLGPDL